MARLSDGAANELRDRVVREMKRIIAENPKVPNRRAFAEFLGIDPSGITAWEDGSGMPTLKQVAVMVQKLGADPVYMLKGRGGMGRDIEVLSRLEDVEKALKGIQKKRGW